MANKIVVNCTVCSKEFNPKPSKSGKYCSLGCYRAWQKGPNFTPARKPKFNGRCSHCQVEVYGKTPSKCRDGSPAKNLFCGRTCYDAFRVEVTRKRQLRGVPCGHCGKHVPRMHDQANGQKKYCSEICWKTEKKAKSKNCKVCNCWFTPVYYAPSRGRYIGVNNRVTCSAECVSRNFRESEERKLKISKAFRGEKHPNWQGGPASRTGRGYRGAGWDRIRKSIRKRDGYECQDCGISEADNGATLEVHHKRPFNQFHGDNQKANKPSNLVALCRPCHQKAEWRWRKDNPIQMGLTLDGDKSSPLKPAYPADLTGIRFGDLIAISKAPCGKGGSSRWNTNCKRCGNDKAVWRGGLVKGSTVDCGCRFRERREAQRLLRTKERALKRVMPRYWWHVNGSVYRVLADAASANNVSEATIDNWCRGPRKNGAASRGQPKAGCWAVSRNEKSRRIT